MSRALMIGRETQRRERDGGVGKTLSNEKFCAKTRAESESSAVR